MIQYKKLIFLLAISTISGLSGDSSKEKYSSLSCLEAQVKESKSKYEQSLEQYSRLERNSTFIIDNSIFSEVNASRRDIIDGLYCAYLGNREKYSKQEAANYYYHLVQLIAFKYSKGMNYSSDFQDILLDATSEYHSEVCGTVPVDTRVFFEKKFKNKILNFGDTMRILHNKGRKIQKDKNMEGLKHQ